MASLKNISMIIEKIGDLLSLSTDFELGIFDDDLTPVYVTPKYSNSKISAIHVPSLEKVLTSNNLLVNRPKFMPGCVHCKDKDKCRSTIEILYPIKSTSKSIGVICLTSQTKHGDAKLYKNIEKNIEILKKASEAIFLSETTANYKFNEYITNEDSVEFSSDLFEALSEEKINNKLHKTEEAPPSITDPLDYIQGNSSFLATLKVKIAKIARNTAPILIIGETGTGKGLIAKAIHNSSNRASKPFISVNCASIPENLLESELFGYEDGAFTGAKKGGKPGKFELANEGTLFLDEIGDMPLYMQAKLLKVLQEYEIERLGGIRAIHLNIRIIAATNQSLEDLLFKGNFRRDLYYRLNVIPLHLPPLRMRKEDIEPIAKFFLEKYSKKCNKMILSISKEAMNYLLSYDWPGNVRELGNALEYGVNMEETSTISHLNLPDSILGIKYNEAHSVDCINEENKAEVKKIITALNLYGWDVNGKTMVADSLGISVRTLYRKIKYYRIEK